MDAALAAAGLHSLTAHLKLPLAPSPTALPPPPALRAAVDAAVPAAAARDVAVEPGCVLVTVDALLPSRSGFTSAQAAERLAAALQADGTGALPASQGAFTAAGSTRWPVAGQMAHEAPHGPVQLILPPLALALPPAEDEHLILDCAVRGDAALPALFAFSARCAGHALRIAPPPGNRPTRLLLHAASLRALGAGTVLLHVTQAGPAAELRISAPRAVLVCDAASAAQVTSALASVGSDDARAQQVLRILGAGLRRDATSRLRAAAAAAAVWLGCDAVVTALMRAAAAEGDPPGAPADAAAELALHVSSHARAARSAGFIAAADAAEAAAAAAGGPSASAWALARQLMAQAVDEGSDEREAAFEALLLVEAGSDETSLGAVRVLRAVLAALEAAGEAEVEVMEGSTCGYEEAEYIHYLLHSTRYVHGISAGLTIGQNLALLLKCWYMVLVRPAAGRASFMADLGPASLSMLAGVTLISPDGSTLAPEAVPWAVVVRCVRGQFLGHLLIMLPLSLLWGLYALRLFQARVPVAQAQAHMARLLAAVFLLQVVHSVLDMDILAATGAVPVWPTAPRMIRAYGIAVVHGRALMLPRFAYLHLFLYFVNYAGPLLAAGQLRILCSPALVIIFGVIAGVAALVPRRAARSRAVFAQLRAEMVVERTKKSI